MIKKKKPKVLLLFSGGLDSILAAKILSQQARVTGLNFTSFFFGSQIAQKMAKQIGLQLKIVDFSQEHLKIVKKPNYGYGQAVNPCIDCHILMLKLARKIMVKNGYDLVATGEVLGERPMSQNKKSIDLIEQKAGLGGYLLRPLSAKLLLPSVAEKKGLIEREKLLAISGRSRKPQLALVKKIKIKNYPTPAGGCLLCEIEFGKKLKALLKTKSRLDQNDIELIKIGRHFWPDNIWINLGRNHEENVRIKKLARSGDVIVELNSTLGPTALIRGKKINESVVSQAKDLIFKYAKKAKIDDKFNIVRN